MIINAKADHIARVRRKRARNDRLEGFVLSLPVEVRELGLDEAPVAMWWTPPHGYRDAAPRREAVRVIDGEFYVPMTGVEVAAVSGNRPDFQRKAKTRGSALLPLIGVKGLVEALDFRELDPNSNMELQDADYKGSKCWLPSVSACALADDDGVAEILEHNGAEVESRVKLKIASLALVDGIAHKRVGMPMIALKPDAYALGVQTFYMDSHYTPDRPDLCWPAHEFKQAVKEWAEIHDLLEKKHPDPDERSRQRRADGTSVGAAARDIIRDSRTVLDMKLHLPEVLIPEAFEFDAPEWAARAVAKRCLASISGENSRDQRGHSALAGYSRPVLVGYVGLRDALAEDAPLREIADRMESLGAACDHHAQIWGERGACLFAAERLRLSLDRGLHAVADDDLSAISTEFSL